MARDRTNSTPARVAIVTGAGSGLGAAVAKRFIEDGFAVALADIDRARTAAVAKSAGGTALACRTDVRSESSMVRLFDTVERQLGPTAILVCCAGGTRHTHGYQPSIAETPLGDWVATEALNARSAFLCVREMLRRRAKRPLADARIVLISSSAAQRPSIAAGAAYGASKAAVIALARVAALEAAPYGMTVNTIAPGPFDTPAFHRATSAAKKKQQTANVPLRRIGQPRELAALVAYLASRESGFVTGAVFDINGGSRMA